MILPHKQTLIHVQYKSTDTQLTHNLKHQHLSNKPKYQLHASLGFV